MEVKRICLEDKDGVYGEIDIRKEEGNIYNIYHTYVSEEYRGKGIAGKLFSMAIEYIDNMGGIAKADCSYAAKKLSEMK